MSRTSRSELLREIEALRARLAQLGCEGGDSAVRMARRLELAVRGTADGLWYWEPDAAAEWWSPRLRELLGYSAEELPASFESMQSLLHPDDREETFRALCQHVRDKTSYRVEYRLWTKHDGYRWFLARGVAEWDEAGRPSRMGGSLQDITECKEFENALRREKELSESLIGSSLDGILAFDRELRYTIWNPAMEQISGVSHSTVVGRSAFDVFPFLRESGEERYMREALVGKTQATRDRPYLVPETGREGYFEGYYSPLRNESGEIIGGLGIIRDITERKRAESERERLEEQLRHSQKMEAIGQLAGGIAHDFNNLLTSVLGNAQLLRSRLDGALDGAPDGDPGEAFLDGLRLGLEQIRDAGERAAMLTQQLLAFSRKQVIQPEVLDLRQVVGGLEDLLRSLIREDIDLSVSVEPGTRCIRAGASQLEQVLINLVVNARDAMPSGGKLAITASNAPAPEALQDTGPQVLLSVSDTGVGMDREQVRRAFEPFFTTKEKGKGTGLGLASAYGVVTQLGGSIRVESEPDKGSTFRLYFPSAPSAPSAAAEQAPGPEPGGSGTILVCEDNPSVRRVVCSALRQAGYRILDTEEGEQALEIAASFEGRIDLLVTDVVMPGMSGKELADRMIQRYPGMRVLLTSGYADDVLGGAFDRSEERDYLQKPFSPRALLESVRELLTPA